MSLGAADKSVCATSRREGRRMTKRLKLTPVGVRPFRGPPHQLIRNPGGGKSMREGGLPAGCLSYET
jgi:hypothetical protein